MEFCLSEYKNIKIATDLLSLNSCPEIVDQIASKSYQLELKKNGNGKINKKLLEIEINHKPYNFEFQYHQEGTTPELNALAIFQQNE